MTSTPDQFEALFGKIRWTNVFQNALPTMAHGLESDYGKLHEEESVNSAAWLVRLTEMLNEPTLIEEVTWTPSIEIIMET